MMHRTSLAYLAATLFVLPAVACNGDDDDNNSMQVSVGMTFSMTAAGTGDMTGDGDGTMTDDGDGGTTMGGADTAADADTGPGPTGDGPMTGSSDDGMPTTPTCQHQCLADTDCFFDGEETAFTCNMGACSVPCADDAQCIAAFSGWTIVPCTGDGDCSGGVCVDTGAGVGGCSLQPSQGACSEADLVEMQATAIGGGMVTVCGQPEALCSNVGQPQCILGCAANGCLAELQCQADGICHCEFDTQCVDAGTGNNCNADGLCEFACTAVGDCPAPPWDGGMLVCQ